jgi:hypothetical protein
VTYPRSRMDPFISSRLHQVEHKRGPVNVIRMEKPHCRIVMICILTWLSSTAYA